MYNVTFSAGETSASFDVQIIDDDLIETNEILQFMILQDSLPYGVSGGTQNKAVVFIIDDAGNDKLFSCPI